MLRALYSSGECLENCKKLRHKEIPLSWIDLYNPTQDEEEAVEQLLDIEIPTHEEIHEIEQSSRLYQEDSSIYLTASLPVEKDGNRIEIAPITFVITKKVTVTVRYEEIPLIESLIEKPSRLQLPFHRPNTEIAPINALLDVIVDNLADLLEKSISEVALISRELFNHSDVTHAPLRKNGHRDFGKILFKIGIQGDAISTLRDSLLSLSRLVSFLNKRTDKSQFGLQDSLLSTLEKDLLSISDHALFVSNKVTFLLEATLGMINIEQNTTIKTFSVASVIFLPPTLLASIWGMNYKDMPELSSSWGYPLALFCIILSSMIPYWYFKKKHWL